MRMPFERLMEFAAGLDLERDKDKTMGELARPLGEAPERLMDAIDAVRVMRGERTYISPADIRAASEPVVREVLMQDRGGVASGALTSPFEGDAQPQD
jgi:hypothetical protein